MDIRPMTMPISGNGAAADYLVVMVGQRWVEGRPVEPVGGGDANWQSENGV
jgi:hypothetical protein